uniref:ZP domain-containing protein n=1 Tax=Panagrellus redivivus TaxID=6233 RepID=A0A7E4WA74_PANRE
MWEDQPKVHVYSEDALVCPYGFIFGLTTDRDEFKMMMWWFHDPLEFYYINETCKNATAVGFGGYSGAYEFVIRQHHQIKFGCVYMVINKNYNFQNMKYSVFANNNSCNFWFCMGPMEQFKRQPPYPAFTLPVDRENYYLAGDSLPKELQATDIGFAIDVLKASGQVFTVYKTPKRPIQTIEVKISKHCSDMVISMDFDGMCTISADLRTNQATYYVNGINIHVGTRPIEIVITFTYSTAYLYTFGTLGFYPLTDCKFDTTLVEKAEYNLKVWYDETRVSSSCETIKLRISDVAAIKRWTTTTTTSTTTTTTTALTEAPTTELSASTASTKIWAVVAVVCFTALVVVIVSVLLLIWWLRKH